MWQCSASGSDYHPRSVDWSGLLRRCRELSASGLRVRPHDAASLLSAGCPGHGVTGGTSDAWWAQVQQLAHQHSASAADTLAVCAAAHLQRVGGHGEDVLHPLRLGRLDHGGASARPSIQFDALWAKLNMLGELHAAAAGMFVQLANAYAAFGHGADASAQRPLLESLLHKQPEAAVSAAGRLLQQTATTAEILAVMEAVPSNPPVNGGRVVSGSQQQAGKPGTTKPGVSKPGVSKPGVSKPTVTKPVTSALKTGAAKPRLSRSPPPPPPRRRSGTITVRSSTGGKPLLPPPPRGGKPALTKAHPPPHSPPPRPPPSPPPPPPPSPPPPPPSPPPPPPPVDPVQPRIEINDIDKRPATDRYKILLVLSYIRMFQLDPSDPESYFQLSGIHGVPYQAYNNTYGAQQLMGYCFHSSVLFPTWHRPMVYHFERALMNAAAIVAASFVNADERWLYMRVAQQLRLPYFDWANPYLGAGDFPYMLSSSTIQVDDPNTEQTELVTINNPFYGFTLPVTVGNGNSWPSTISAGMITIRRPRNDGFPQTDQAGFVASMQNNQATFANQVYNILGAGTWDCLYNGFCSVGVTDLESLHNAVHGAVGGNMGVVPTSSFDPMFWLHHAQMDRLVWLWQQRFPTVWLTPRYETTGSFYTDGNQVMTSSTPLAPFYKQGTTMFTSDDVRDITPLGYSFSPPAGGDVGRRRRLQAAAAEGSNAAAATAGARGAASEWADAVHMYSSGYYGYRWQVNFLQCDKMQLGRPFYIHVFLAKGFKKQPQYQHASALPGHCGTFYAFSGTTEAMPSNVRHIDVTLDLTHCLHRAGIETDVPAQHVATPESGPASQPTTLSQLVWVAALRNGTDVSHQFKFGAPKLSWSLMRGSKLHIGTLAA